MKSEDPPPPIDFRLIMVWIIGLGLWAYQQYGVFGLGD